MESVFIGRKFGFNSDATYLAFKTPPITSPVTRQNIVLLFGIHYIHGSNQIYKDLKPIGKG